MIDRAEVTPGTESTDAGRLARDAWGLEGRVEPLAGEVDRNFLLIGADGQRRVLKISRPGTDELALDCQLQVLRHLEGSAVARLVQRVLPAADGRNMVPFEPGNEGRCWARVLSYLDGSPLAGFRQRPRSLHGGIGRTLARLDLALADFDHPGAHRQHPWRIERTDDLAQHVPHIADGSRRELVKRRLEDFRGRVAPRLHNLDRSVIHNDANDHNLLVTGGDDGFPELAGLIDFGDCLHTVTVAELAIAATYLMLDRDDPLAVAAEAAAGYHAVRPLSEDESNLLFDLILTRLTASVLMSARGRHAEPDNEYLQISEQPVWRLLERLSMIDPDGANRSIHEACATPRSRLATD